MSFIVVTPTPNINQSLSFYKTLNFESVSTGIPNIISDGSVILEVDEDRFSRAGVKLFVENPEAMLKSISGFSKTYKQGNNFFIISPSGMRVFFLPKELDPKYNITNIKPSLLGSYAGISLESADMSKSMEFWQLLDFKVSMGGVDQGWVALANDQGDTISLMQPMSCPHLFFNPSLTYFNGINNLSIIEGIKNAKIEITEEITHFNPDGVVDNIIIRDPGGFGFFIFSD